MHRQFSLLALLIVLALSAGLPSLGSDPQETPASPLFGSLEPYGTGLPQRGQWRNGFAVADMNGDRVLDIVHGPPRKGRGWPVIFIGDGKGGFTRWAATFPQLPFDYGVVAVADFDRDGRADDIAIGCHLRGIAVLTGDGKGEFKQWGRGLELRATEPGRDIPFCPGALVAVDWNKDGRTDLAALSEGPARLALRDRMTAGQGAGIRVFLNEAKQWRAVVPEQGDEFLDRKIVSRRGCRSGPPSRPPRRISDSRLHALAHAEQHRSETARLGAFAGAGPGIRDSCCLSRLRPEWSGRPRHCLLGSLKGLPG